MVKKNLIGILIVLAMFVFATGCDLIKKKDSDPPRKGVVGAPVEVSPPPLQAAIKNKRTTAKGINLICLF